MDIGIPVYRTIERYGTVIPGGEFLLTPGPLGSKQRSVLEALTGVGGHL